MKFYFTNEAAATAAMSALAKAKRIDVWNGRKTTKGFKVEYLPIGGTTWRNFNVCDAEYFFGTAKAA